MDDDPGSIQNCQTAVSEPSVASMTPSPRPYPKDIPYLLKKYRFTHANSISQFPKV